MCQWGKWQGNRELNKEIHCSSLPRAPYGEIPHDISAKSVI